MAKDYQQNSRKVEDGFMERKSKNIFLYVIIGMLSVSTLCSLVTAIFVYRFVYKAQVFMTNTTETVNTIEDVVSNIDVTEINNCIANTNSFLTSANSVIRYSQNVVGEIDEKLDSVEQVIDDIGETAENVKDTTANIKSTSEAAVSVKDKLSKWGKGIMGIGN